MGEYTANQNFYKPDPDEFVDVDSQIAYNFRRADERVRAMVEYQYTDVPVISGVEPSDKGYKFFKASTNTVYVRRTEDLILSQASPNGDTDSFTTSGLSSQNGYRSVDFATQQLSYRVEPTSGVCTWRGSVQLNDAADQIPLNTNTVVFTMPAAGSASPTPIARSKYFLVHMGIATGGFSILRIFFGSNGNIEINRMGINQTDPTQRYISFNDIQYPTRET